MPLDLTVKYDLGPFERKIQESSKVLAQQNLNSWLKIFEKAKAEAMAETEEKAKTDAEAIAKADAKTKAKVREFITKVTFLELKAKMVVAEATDAIGPENHVAWSERRRKFFKALEASSSEAEARIVRFSRLEGLEIAMDILRRIQAILEDPKTPMKDKLVYDIPLPRRRLLRRGLRVQ